jgi:nicotinate phosphoribosyltransferase
VSGPWLDETNVALLADLYQFTMLEAYLEEGLQEEAAFSLFVRRLPSTRNFLVACGLDALPEGTPLFADEPLLEVVAPLPQAQLVETSLMNQIHVQTMAASKSFA